MASSQELIQEYCDQLAPMTPDRRRHLCAIRARECERSLERAYRGDVAALEGLSAIGVRSLITFLHGVATTGELPAKATEAA